MKNIEIHERITKLEVRQEHMLGKIQAHMDSEEKDRAVLVSMLQKQDSRLDGIEANISTAKTIVRILKFVGAAALLLLTLKFGDLPKLYHEMISR